MASFVNLLAAASVIAIAGAHSGYADPNKDESGHGRSDSKVEWRDGDCKYERKVDGGGFKEEYKCDGGSYEVAGPPSWAPAHGYRKKKGKKHYHDYGAYGYTPPLDLDAGRCNRDVIGQLIGGAAGAAAGSQIGSGSGRIAAIIGGSIVGVLVGGEIGRSMDRADALCVDQTLEYVPDGQTVTWAGGNQNYRVTPRQTYQTDSGRYCREYQALSTIGGETVETYGTACRQPDGAWKIVE